MMSKTISAMFSILTFLLLESAYASNIADITVDEMGIPFLLDDEGHVWAFRKPLTSEEPIKLPHLEHIKKIAPYIAIDTEGRVFTWSLKDSLMREDQDVIVEAGYTAPKRREDLQGVTFVAHSLNHFFAVVGNKEIVEWLEIRKKRSFEIEGYGPTRKVVSRAGIKAIAAAPGKMERVVAEPAPYGLVALFDDGMVMGWGITSTGQLAKEAGAPGIVLTQSPGAIGIAVNAFHTVVLTEDGVPKFWGGCDLYGRDGNGHIWTHGHVLGVDGYLTDVMGMALAQDIVWGSDTGNPDVYIRHDGTVWLAFAPLPEGAPAFLCGHKYKNVNYRQAQQLPVGNASSVKTATSRGVVYVLDADHTLWTTAGSWMNTKLRVVPVNLK